MLIEYLPIAILLVFAIGLAVIVVALGHLLALAARPSANLMPYESGMTTDRTWHPPDAGAFLPGGGSVHPVRHRNHLFPALGGRLPQPGIFGLIEMRSFILILLVGYVYAWKKGALEWE